MQFNVMQFDTSHRCRDWCNTLLWSLVQVNVLEFDAIVKCKSLLWSLMQFTVWEFDAVNKFKQILLLNIYSNGVGSQVLTTLVTTLPLNFKHT